jgi:putative salt-induced outer membrane protein YdiY
VPRLADYAMNQERAIFAAALTAWFLQPAVLARDKKDVVYFANGDRMTCEIVSLGQGALTVKLDYGDGSIALDWLRVVRIESPQQFLVTDTDGRTVAGTLRSPEVAPTEQPELKVSGHGRETTVSRSKVVKLEQSETSFWKDIDGSVNLGFQLSDSNSQATYNLNSNAAYRRIQWEAALLVNSSFSGRLDDRTDLRNQVQAGWDYRLHDPRYYLGTFANFLQSQPEQLKLRANIGEGLIRYFKNTNTTRLRLLVGLAWSREIYTDTETGTAGFHTLEGAIMGSAQLFRFKKYQLATTVAVFPNLTNTSRVRVDSNTSLTVQAIRNFTRSLSIYTNYDNQPPRNTKKSDHGVSSNVGWTF